MDQAVTNPGGAFGYTTLDETSGVFYREIQVAVVASTTLPVKGDVCVWGGQTTNVKPTCHQADVSADDPALVCGVALEDASAVGDVIKVACAGPVIVNIGNGTVAAGERATLHASADGCADSAAADASTIAGDTFGVMLGAEIGTSNTAVLDVRCMG